jgi:hypothetical protein
VNKQYSHGVKFMAILILKRNGRPPANENVCQRTGENCKTLFLAKIATFLVAQPLEIWV